jgi:Mg2+ and Co2+ transporter CorA
MFKVIAVLSLVMVLSGLVSAIDAECNFTGGVHLNKSDLAPYTQDQVGCALQRMNESWGIFLIMGTIFLILLFIYGLYRRRK